MLLWRLWHAIQNPPSQQAIYRRGSVRKRLQSPRVTGMFFPWMMMFAGFGFCSASTWTWLPTLLIVSMFLLNVIYALTSGVAVSDAIVKEKVTNRYPLLASSPTGTFGTAWATCVMRLHRRSSFAWVPFLVGLISIVVAFTLVLIVLMTFVVAASESGAQASEEVNQMIMRQAAGAIGLVILFCFDHFYSLVTAALLGMLVPVDEANPSEAQVRTLGIFLTIQLAMYFVCFSVFFGTQTFGLPSLGNTVEQVVLTILVYIIAREVSLHWLWRVLVNQLNAAMPEAEAVLQSS
ncbi:MAG: hypothetical protein KC708_01360 [Anaerolineae bacterium]|nr:hypothetical protein [Anaerolineae bacterium]